MISPGRSWREFPQRYRLEASKCTACGKVNYPPRVVCPACRKAEFEEIVATIERLARALGQRVGYAAGEGTFAPGGSLSNLAAMLMAICCHGMDADETRWLTEEMLNSGEVWNLAEDRPEVVDKHSTGGVGDTVSLVLAPMLAAHAAIAIQIGGIGTIAPELKDRLASFGLRAMLGGFIADTVSNSRSGSPGPAPTR